MEARTMKDAAPITSIPMSFYDLAQPHETPARVPHSGQISSLLLDWSPRALSKLVLKTHQR